jgi:DNA-binding PadR family transcriptional regulator
MNINSPICKAILFGLLRKENQTLHQLSKTTRTNKGHVSYWLRNLEKERYISSRADKGAKKYSLSESVVPELRVKGEGITLIISEDTPYNGKGG